MMKNDKKIIDYSVVGATSEDPEHPLYSIISNEKKEGWCSSPFCKYPQEIIIQLNKQSKLIIFTQNKKKKKEKIKKKVLI